MRNSSKITLFVEAMWGLWRGTFGQCTFDQPTGPLDRSSPVYYDYVPDDNIDSAYVTASVTSNNGCDQSSLVSAEYHYPYNYVSSLKDVYCLTYLKDSLSGSTST